MMSCAVECTGHGQYRHIDVMHRYFDFSLFTSHMACYFSTFGMYLQFKSGNPDSAMPFGGFI